MILSKYLPGPIPPTGPGLESLLAAWAGGPKGGLQTGVRVCRGGARQPQLWERSEAAAGGELGPGSWCRVTALRPGSGPRCQLRHLLPERCMAMRTRELESETGFPMSQGHGQQGQSSPRTIMGRQQMLLCQRRCF